MSNQKVTRETIGILHAAADDLGRAVGEITCITKLLEHPWRNRRDITEWTQTMHDLGWVEQDGIVWP